MEINEQIERFKEFIEGNYKSQLYEAVQQGKKSLVISFQDLAHFDHELADSLLESPEDTIRAAELAAEQFDLPEDAKRVTVRIKDLPESQKIRISNIRSVHLDKFLYIDGIVRQASDVRPQVVSAKFECAGCGNTLSILQIDTKFKEPSRCTCGWRGKFRLLSKDLIDVQHLKIEEAPESLEGGEQPKRLSIFLKEDLVEPRMEKKTTPGSKIGICGVVKEVPIQLKTGVQSVRYDLILEANYVEPIQEDYSNIILTKEDEENIITLSKDPKIFDKFARSIAPSIYGHDKIKEALVLQLFGGVRREKPDGTVSRGDVHMLLVGDPGCIAGDSQVALYYKGMNQIKNLGEKHLQPIKQIVSKIRRDQYDKPYDFATVFQKYIQQPVLKVTTESGKEVICTYNQPLLTKKGWERADKLIIGTKIRVAPQIPNNVKTLVKTNFIEVKAKFGKLKEVVLPEFVNNSLAALYGYIIGDGHLKSNGYSVTCYVNNEETDLIDPLTSFWKDSFNVEPRYFITNEEPQVKTIENNNGTLRQIVSVQIMHNLEINSKQVAQALAFLSNKRVPQQIFQSPKEVISTFLAWLFEADGCDFGNGRGRTAIQLKSSNPRLLKDVQLLLLYFGIHSRIGEDNLYIRRANDMSLFIKHIGFVSQKKRDKLNDIIRVVNLRAQRRKLYQRWEKIKKVESCGAIDVYDFEVPVSHKFIANGIVCHNSGKSQMLQFISKAAPKARFVSGKGASGTGLTASVVKDEFLKGWALEAGALVLANKGLCCLHPSTKVIIDGKIRPIESLYNSDLSKHYTSNDERVSVNEFNKTVSSFNWGDLSSFKNISTKIRRKQYKGDLLALKFKSGFNIILTKDHKLINGANLKWQESSNFKIGDCTLAPMKLDFENKPILFLEILPDFWKVKLTKEQKSELKEIILGKFSKYASFNKKFLIDKNYLSGGKQLNLKKFKEILKYLGIYDSWKNKAFWFIRSKGGQKIATSKLTPELSYIFGFAIGDGHMFSNKKKSNFTIYQSEIHKPFIERLQEYAKKSLGREFNIYKRIGSSPDKKRNDVVTYHLYFNSNLLCALVNSSIGKQFENILSLPTDCFKAFVAGLMDSDGCFSDKNSVKKGKNYSVQHINFLISNDWQANLNFILALRRFDLYAKVKNYRGGVLNVEITGRKDFHALLDSIKDYSIKASKKILISRLVNISSTSDKLPIDIVANIANNISRLSKSLLIKQGIWSYVYNYKHKLIKPSRDQLKKFLDRVGGFMSRTDRFVASNLLKRDFFLDEIIEIKEIPYEGYVYDLYVPKSHNFLADGIIVHNCIDELDKIDKEDTGALHSAMEQQIIPISKANIQACYSEDTEVLTDFGWKKYSEVKESSIAQYNPQNKTIKFLKHKGLFIYDYKGLMYHFKNKRNDILVTPNHKMLYKEDRHKDYSFAEAQNINYKRFKFLNSGNFVGEEAPHFVLPPINHKQNRTHPKYVHQHSPKKIPMDLWLEFLGYYLSEGGLENRPTFGINQKSGKNAIKIKNCLVKLSNYVGFTLTELKDGPYYRFQITNTQLCTYLEANFGDHCFNKKLNIDFSKFSKGQLKILFDSMMLGDGTSDGKSYGSTSLELIDGFHALACLVGMSASNNIHYNKDYRKNRRKMYRVTLSKRMKLSFIRSLIKKIKYKGKVFCFATDTGFFITRRNGKIAIQGNTLSAQTTLLAAANPKFGRFDPYTPIAAQIDLPPTLINRFDLIFPIRDIPSKDRDEKIALHVLETAHKEETYRTDITTDVLRRYIAYAKQKIKPTMTKAAINEIKDYYVKLRNSGKADDEGIKPIPISARQLEGLIRLAEASARVRLDDEVTKEDARKAIDLLTHCLMQVGFDPETGQIDIDRISTGITASTRSKIIAVKEIIFELSAKGMKEVPIEEVFSQAALRGIEEGKVEDAIDQLKKSGDVFEPKRGFISRVG